MDERLGLESISPVTITFLHNGAPRFVRRICPDHGHQSVGLIQKSVCAGRWDKCCVISAQYVSLTLHHADRLAFDDGDRFVTTMNVAWQRGARFKATVTTADSISSEQSPK